ncbi:MAG TPA: cupin domain-containing protein [Ilumatobacteraceae bacterium]|mgnify:CR=1 FL=1|nr:cupin domain-containing protein [Ilumatobacteraceae bacterium]
MTLLVISPADTAGTVQTHTTDPTQIAAELAKVGVDFGRWSADVDLSAEASAEEILRAYAPDVRRLAERGYTTVDVARMVLDPNADGYADSVAAARSKFLAEHRHADDEVRFFVEGSGAFYLHIDGRVLAVVCEAGDYISVPAGTTHWFDMGSRPRFTAIRFFQSADGWVGDFTGSDIAERFPTYDELVA